MGRNKKNREFLPYVKEELLTKINKLSIHLEKNGVLVENVVEETPAVPVVGKRGRKKRGDTDYVPKRVKKSFEEKNAVYQVVTCYEGKEIKRAVVSDRYGVGDFKKYALDALSRIENNGFKITEYRFDIIGGIQEIQLLSDIVMINGITFRKSFYIINSTDRSRPLDYYLGLYCKESTTDSDMNYISDSKLSISERVKSNKKHYSKNMKEVAEFHFNLDANIFDEQIKDLNLLIGAKINYSDLRKTLLSTNDEKNAKPSKHVEFDLLRKKIENMANDLGLDKGQYAMLKTPSAELGNYEEEITATISNGEFQFVTPKDKNGVSYVTTFASNYDFQLDAFAIFKAYLLLYGTRDSYVVKAKSRALAEVTNSFKRLSGLNVLIGTEKTNDEIIESMQK